MSIKLICHSSSSKGQKVPHPSHHKINESSSSIWWAVLGGRGTSAWGGGGGGGGNPRFPTPLYETLIVDIACTYTCIRTIPSPLSLSISQ